MSGSIQPASSARLVEQLIRRIEALEKKLRATTGTGGQDGIWTATGGILTPVDVPSRLAVTTTNRVDIDTGRFVVLAADSYQFLGGGPVYMDGGFVFAGMQAASSVGSLVGVVPVIDDGDLVSEVGYVPVYGSFA